MSELAADPLPSDPMALAEHWLDQARSAAKVPNPNAMTVASTDSAGRPSARIVLCKQWVSDPGYLVWYTNYESRKGAELDARGYGCAVLHFDHFGRQVRVEGPVVRSPATESDTYFQSRPWQSRIGARASQQSQPVASRAALAAAAREEASQFGLPDPGETPLGDRDADIPRPAHWGGYRLWAERVELWCDGHARLHDRARWSRRLTGSDSGEFAVGSWSVERLSP